MRMKVFVSNVIEHKHHDSETVGSVELQFAGCYEGSEENKKFWDATPALSIDCNIANVAAVPEGIKVGDEFYVDFTRAREDGDREEPSHHPAVAAVLRYFAYGHLPESLQAISRPFAELAEQIAARSSNPEATVALRKLLESKDAAVRATLP